MRVLVTGAARGVGLGVATAFAERGEHVLATCRSSSAELDALGVEVIDGIELTSDRAVARLARRVAGAGDLDVLVCNAGVNLDGAGLADIDVDRLRQMFEVNALGAVRVVLALLDHLREGSKILLVTTGGMTTLNIGAPSGGNYGYRMSKAALVSFGHGLARDLRPRGIAVAMVSPGPVDTDLLRERVSSGLSAPSLLDGASDIVTAGRLLRDRLDELTVERSPSWLRTPYGNPVIPEHLSSQLSG